MNLHLNKTVSYYNYAKRTVPTVMRDAHFHQHHELYFLEKGNTIHFVGDQIYLMEEGDMVFVPSGVFHRTDNKDTNYIERHLFIFPENVIDEDCMPYIEELKKNNYFKIPRKHVHLITDIARKMSYEFENKKTDYLKMQRFYLHELLILISRLRVTNPESQTNVLYQTIQEILTYISENVNDDLSLDALSLKYGVSPSHLSRQFRNVTGMGLNEYSNIAKITAAEKLLANTSLPITEVAIRCGFNDSQYFARVFKKLRGTTPKKYSMQVK